MTTEATGRTPGWRRLLPFAAIVLFLLGVAATTWRISRNADVPGQPKIQQYGFQDFRDAFYYPARALLDGVNPYDPVGYQARYPVARPTSPYAPHSFVLHLPFTLFDYGPARWVHYLFNLGLLLTIAAVTLRTCRRPITIAALFLMATAILLARPSHQTLFLGQVTFLVTLGVYLALVNDQPHSWWAAAGVALAAVKPTYGAPLVILLLAQGRFRTVLRGTAIAVALVLPALPSLAASAGGLVPLVKSMFASYSIMEKDHAANAATSVIRLDTPAIVARLSAESPSDPVEAAIGLGVLLLGCAAVARLARIGTPESRLATITTAILTLMLCTYHLAYDGILLAIPAAAIFLGTGPGRPGPGWAGVPIGALLLLLVPAVNYLATDTMMERLQFAPGLEAAITVANGVALFVVWVIFVMRALRTPARAEAQAGSAR
ncbi:MAG TPA: glycosyltransferase family 87 protein [Candidatus Polarisedimenticolia bacterium]|nr:glycosyltransferase family 87 protein [Candidatus Polarisedimenticolia bacterium]